MPDITNPLTILDAAHRRRSLARKRYDEATSILHSLGASDWMSLAVVNGLHWEITELTRFIEDQNVQALMECFLTDEDFEVAA